VVTLDDTSSYCSKGFRQVRLPHKHTVSRLLLSAAYFSGAVVLVERGNCSFVDKYQAVVAAGGSGMILFDDIPGVMTSGEALVGYTCRPALAVQQRT
jgi:hypothetical protein